MYDGGMSALLQDYGEFSGTAANPKVALRAVPALAADGVQVSGISSVDRAASRLAASTEGGAIETLSFEGRLKIPGLAFYPRQKWAARFTADRAVFENKPEDFWPKVRVEFVPDKPFIEPTLKTFLATLPRLIVSRLDVIPAGDNAIGEVRYTRVVLCADAGRKTALVSHDGSVIFSLRHEPLVAVDDRRELEFRASLYRKVLFLESMFSTQFTLPTDMAPDDVRLIETAFDGVAKGVAVTRGSDITVRKVRGREFALNSPPFSGPGRFEHVVSYKGRWMGLFGQKLDVGKVTLLLDGAEASDPSVVDQMAREPDATVDLRLVVYDHQVKHRFKKFLACPLKERQAWLRKFKKEALGQEPVEIAGLIDRPLIRDVGSEEALHISKGWLYLNRFTERYCPQEPLLDSDGRHWVVPVNLVYTDGRGGPVGELEIDIKTGVVTSHTPVDQLQDRAVALAESIFHG